MQQTQQSRTLTPRQRLRQLEPSWLRNGHTTSLLASETEKDEVRADRGGIVLTDEVASIPIPGGARGRLDRGLNRNRGRASIDKECCAVHYRGVTATMRATGALAVRAARSKSR